MYKEYLVFGKLHQDTRKRQSIMRSKKVAVNLYFEYGHCYVRTIRMLGYPNRESLRQWCEEFVPNDLSSVCGQMEGIT